MAIKKPILVMCGEHLINPNDVSRITRKEVIEGAFSEVKSIYLVKFISNPTPTYECWLERNDVLPLMKHFNIIGGAPIKKVR